MADHLYFVQILAAGSRTTVINTCRIRGYFSNVQCILPNGQIHSFCNCWDSELCSIICHHKLLASVAFVQHFYSVLFFFNHVQRGIAPLWKVRSLFFHLRLSENLRSYARFTFLCWSRTAVILFFLLAWSIIGSWNSTRLSLLWRFATLFLPMNWTGRSEE